jgi:uncharacterized membrane protein YccC
MKLSALVVAGVLLLLAVSFALVRADLMDASFLRFLPQMIAALVGVAIVLAVAKAARSRRRRRK